MKLLKKRNRIVLSLLLLVSGYSIAQKRIIDSVVYNFIRKDTVIHIYKYDTILIKHYIHSDTVFASTNNTDMTATKKKGLINSAQWGIGPSFGAYYSPLNGFDMNIGFGVQYYFLSIPSIRNPHLGHRRKK
jgi:hypothetical protein